MPFNKVLLNMLSKFLGDNRKNTVMLSEKDMLRDRFDAFILDSSRKICTDALKNHCCHKTGLFKREYSNCKV